MIWKEKYFVIQINLNLDETYGLSLLNHLGLISVL